MTFQEPVEDKHRQGSSKEERWQTVILDGKPISLTGLIVLYVFGGAALLYTMFAFSGWRRAFLALGIAAAGLTVSVLALKYGLHSYEQEKLRRKGHDHGDHIVK